MASDKTTFDAAKAKAWISSVEALNAKTDEMLKKVSNCLTEIQAESSGDTVSRVIYEVGAQLLPKFTELVKSLGTLIKALQDVIDKFSEFVDAVTDSIKSAARSMVGGLSIG